MIWSPLQSRKTSRRRSKHRNQKTPKKLRSWQPGIELLEVRAVPSSSTVPTFGANAQHTSLYAGPSQNLNQVIWKTPVENFFVFRTCWK